MATITKLKSGNFRIRKNYKGKTYSCILDYQPSKNEADRILFNMIEKDVTPSKSNLTFYKAAQEYIELNKPVLSPSTIRGYSLYLRQFDDKVLNKKIHDYDNEFLQKTINSMYNRGLSVKSIKNYVGFIITVIKNYRPNLFIKVTYPKKNQEEPYIPCDDDYTKLLTAAKDTPYEIPLYLAGMGLRLSEICALTQNDFKDNGVYITKSKVRDENNNWIIREVNKTSSSCRFVPLSDNILNLIKTKNKIYDGFPYSITRYIHKQTKALGIRDFTIHKLRHYFATKAHSLFIPDASIMKTGGWSTDYVMKNVYRHADQDRVNNDIEKLHKHFSSLTEKISKHNTKESHISIAKINKHLILYKLLFDTMIKYRQIIKKLNLE